MVKIGHRLLLLLALTWSNAHAWYCTYTPDEDGYMVEESLACVDIDPEIAVRDFWCVSYRPDDPVCDQYKIDFCVDTVEYKTEACEPHYSGGRNFSRTYVCQLQAWSDWSLSSDLCVMDPPSCVATPDSRTLACDSGMEGQIVQTRISSCPDPYGEPVWLEWMETENTCKPSAIDPVSPISVTNPISNPVTSMSVGTATAPAAGVPEMTSPSQEPVDEPVAEVREDVNDETNSEEQVEEEKEDGNDKDSKPDVNEVVDDRKEIVHGFGLTLSQEIFNQVFKFYQPDLTDQFSILQELPNEHKRAEELYLEFLKQDDSEDYYINYSNSLGERLWSNQFLY